MFNKVQTDILKRHVGPFFFCLFTILFLLLMQFLILHVDKLVGKGLDLSIVIELIVLQLAYMLVLAIPMSVLVASLVAYGRFSELSELTAVKAAGVTPIQLMKPVLLIAAIFAVFLTWFSNEVLPEANFKARSLFLDIRMKKPGFDLRTNAFYDGIEGYTFLARDMSAESDTLFGITIFQDANDFRDHAIINAEFGILSGQEYQYRLYLDLFNGSVFRYLPDAQGSTNRIEESQFERHRIRFDLSDLAFSRTNPDLRRRDDRTMSSRAMQAYIDSLKIEIDRTVAGLRDHRYAIAVVEEGVHRAQRGFTQDVITKGPNVTIEPGMRSQQFDPDTTIHYLAYNELAYLESQSNLTNHALSFLHTYESQLTNASVNIRWRTERIAQFQTEIWKKVSIPFGCIIFVLIGAPLGMLSRRGNLGFHAVVSTVLFTYYWITIIQGEKLADRLVVTPFWGMWFGNITVGALGLLLLFRVTTEKRLSDLWRRS